VELEQGRLLSRKAVDYAVQMAQGLSAAEDFVIANGATRQIEKVNLDTGKRGLWRVWKPKDPAGLAPPTVPPAITPDGSKMILGQRKQLSTLYKRQSEIERFRYRSSPSFVR
jgi:hypothetical protein